MKMSIFIKCRVLAHNLELKLCQFINMLSQQGPPPALAIAGCSPATHHSQPSIRESLLGDSILWGVPKTRVSLEKRHKKKNGYSRIIQWATPKKNLVTCLQCGTYHEAHTVCGTCYQKVREETQKMAEAIPEHDRLYNHPRKEIAFVYQGEKASQDDDRQTYNGKYIVEMDRPRPEWWPKHLLPKIQEGGSGSQ